MREARGMSSAKLIPIAVAALALAGCMGADSGASPAATGPEPLANGAKAAELMPPEEALAASLAADPSNATLAVPVWAVGDSWTVVTANGETQTAVVTSASQQSYRLDVTGEQTASYDAIGDVSWIGTIRAADLAGAQQGTAVKFFDFPLADGKTWSTTWDGLEVTMTARLNPALATSAGTQPGFEIVAMAGDAVHATYDFVPSMKWWSRIEWPAQGYGLAVSAYKPNWTGTAIRGTASQILELAAAGPVTNTPAAEFTVSEGQTTVMLLLMGATEQQARAMAIVDPEGQPFPLPEGEDVLVDGMPRDDFTTVQLPPTPGSWKIALAMAHDPEGSFVVFGSEVAMEQIVVGRAA